jgi:hypothetical protein
MMEKLMIAKSRVAAGRGTVLCGTRYGNVMASRGSMIPLFIEQIRQGRPLTVTDPQMTRFMMSIDDAVDLVLYAFEHGQPGDMFVQKAPAATSVTLEGFSRTCCARGSPRARSPSCATLDAGHASSRAKDNPFARREGLADTFTLSSGVWLCGTGWRARCLCDGSRGFSLSRRSRRVNRKQE